MEDLPLSVLLIFPQRLIWRAFLEESTSRFFDLLNQLTEEEKML